MTLTFELILRDVLFAAKTTILHDDEIVTLNLWSYPITSKSFLTPNKSDTWKYLMIYES